MEAGLEGVSSCCFWGPCAPFVNALLPPPVRYGRFDPEDQRSRHCPYLDTINKWVTGVFGVPLSLGVRPAPPQPCDTTLPPGVSWTSTSRSSAPSPCPTSTSTPASSAGSTSRVRPPPGAAGGHGDMGNTWGLLGGHGGHPRAAVRGHLGTPRAWSGAQGVWDVAEYPRGSSDAEGHGEHQGTGILPGKVTGSSQGQGAVKGYKEDAWKGHRGDSQGQGGCWGNSGTLRWAQPPRTWAGDPLCAPFLFPWLLCACPWCPVSP